jgi:hypothetical protein
VREYFGSLWYDVTLAVILNTDTTVHTIWTECQVENNKEYLVKVDIVPRKVSHRTLIRDKKGVRNQRLSCRHPTTNLEETRQAVRKTHQTHNVLIERTCSICDNIIALPGRSAAYIDSSLPTFRFKPSAAHLQGSSSPRRIFLLDCLTLGNETDN